MRRRLKMLSNDQNPQPYDIHRNRKKAKAVHPWFPFSCKFTVHCMLDFFFFPSSTTTNQVYFTVLCISSGGQRHVFIKGVVFLVFHDMFFHKFLLFFQMFGQLIVYVGEEKVR